MLKAFNLLEIFWDYDIVVTIDMPSLGYYSALGLYSAGKSVWPIAGLIKNPMMPSLPALLLFQLQKLLPITTPLYIRHRRPEGVYTTSSNIENLKST